MDRHIAECADCRRLVDAEAALRTCVDRLRPPPAPAHVRLRTAALLADLVRQERARRTAHRARMAVAAMLVFAVGVGAVTAITRPATRTDTLRGLVAAAVAQHRDAVGGARPLEISEVTPGRTEAWLGERLPFPVKLPTPAAGDQQLVGGRIGRLLDTNVAAVEYRVGGAPVSLFVLPEATYRRLRLADAPEFNALRHHDYDVVVWHRGVVGYALVSEIGARACLVCHSPHDALPRL